MTDDTLRQECEALVYKLTQGDTDWGCCLTCENTIPTLLAFARAQQAKGLREAARHLLIDPDNVCDWSDTARNVADAMSNHLEAQATAREGGV